MFYLSKELVLNWYSQLIIFILNYYFSTKYYIKCYIMIILPGLWSTLHTGGHFLIEDCWLLFRDLESINGLPFYNLLMFLNI